VVTVFCSSCSLVRQGSYYDFKSSKAWFVLATTCYGHVNIFIDFSLCEFFGNIANFADNGKDSTRRPLSSPRCGDNFPEYFTWKSWVFIWTCVFPNAWWLVNGSLSLVLLWNSRFYCKGSHLYLMINSTVVSSGIPEKYWIFWFVYTGYAWNFCANGNRHL